MKNIQKVIYVNDNDFSISISISYVNLEKWYQNLLNSEDELIKIANELQLTRLRVGFLEKEISSFVFDFNGKEIEIDENANLKEYPKELELYSNLARKIISLRVNKGKMKLHHI